MELRPTQQNHCNWGCPRHKGFTLAVAFTAKKPDEFGHCSDRISERCQGLLGRIGFWVVVRCSKTAISVGENATVDD